jgi:hypothetical protein
MLMRIPPSVDVVAKVRLAERLGYRRVWMSESPALHGAMWIGLARVAEARERIGPATGVAVPGLRHPMVTASAIGSVAPGRGACQDLIRHGWGADRALLPTDGTGRLSRPGSRGSGQPVVAARRPLTASRTAASTVAMPVPWLVW